MQIAEEPPSVSELTELGHERDAGECLRQVRGIGTAVLRGVEEPA
jgi:hypothetical protein